MIILTINEQDIRVHRGDIVNDTLITSIGTVPFEWSTGFSPSQAIAAIEAFMAGTPLEVNSTGEGWLIDLPSVTHPQAEITDIDFDVDLINFRWRNSVFNGDCAVAFEFTLDTSPMEVAGAIVGLVP